MDRAPDAAVTRGGGARAPGAEAPPPAVVTPVRKKPKRKRGPADPETTTVRRRFYREATNSWSAWVDAAVPAEGLVLTMRRGGVIRVHRDYVPREERAALAESLDACGFFRQYKFGNVPEPRVHMLLAPAGVPLAYQYHGVTMRARPLGDVPSVEALAARCTERFGAPWNVGVDVVCYRDGHDSCGWHSDDTQGETLVLAVVIESRRGLRRIQFRPKQPPTTKRRSAKPKKEKVRRAGDHVGEAPLRDGDEEVELWIDAGDAYSMDRGVQVGYEHAVPKAGYSEGERNAAGRRVVAILREGHLRTAAGADTGAFVASLAPAERWSYEQNGGRFGHVKDLVEGVDASGILDFDRIYSRERLVELGAHNQAQRGVAGALEHGAESVVVSRQKRALREGDGLTWLRYTSTRRQGAAALWRNMTTGQPIRVIRSSGLGGPWAPRKPDDRKEAAVYRYDGLYDVRAMWEDSGRPSTKEPRAPPKQGWGTVTAVAAPPRPSRVDALQNLPPPPRVALVDGRLVPAAAEDLSDADMDERGFPRVDLSDDDQMDRRGVPREARGYSPPAPGGPGAPPAAPAPAAYERAYTFRFERRDGGNACDNATFLEALSKAAGGVQPDPDVFADVATLPPLEHASLAPDSDDEKPRKKRRGGHDEPVDPRDLVYVGGGDPYAWLRSRVAETVSEIVALTVAEDGNVLQPEAAPAWETAMAENGTADAKARWLAHRKLYWRSLKHRAARQHAPPAVADGAFDERAWADALGATAGSTVRKMVAASNKRHASRADVDEAVEVKKDDVSSKACELCGGVGGDGPEGALIAFRDPAKGPILVHDACAACSSEVFYDAAGRHCNVLRAVKRGRFVRCAAGKACVCPKRSGATVGCGVASCKRSFHVKCCLETGWLFGPSRSFFCMQHRAANHDPQDPPEGSWNFDCRCGKHGFNYDDGTAMWECGACFNWQHAACAGGSEDAEMPADYRCWKCAYKRRG